MRSIARLFFLPVSTLFLLFISNGCSDENNKVQDTELPSLEFVQESETQFTGTVSLSFKASDNQSIARVQVFIDGNLVADKTFSSPNEEFTFEWNSRSVADGIHQLKVVVTDADGNVKEETFEITTENVLLKLFIPENYIHDFTFWVFLSDYNGNVLGVQQAHNNTELEFPMLVEGFNDETLIVNLFWYSYYKEGEGQTQISRAIRSYANVKPGDYHLTSYNQVVDTDHGAVTIVVSDIPQGYHDNISGTEIYSSYGFYSDGTTYSTITNISSDHADILITLYHEDGSAKYKLFEHTQGGDEITVSFNDFNDMNVNSFSTVGADEIFQLDVGFRPGVLGPEGFVYNFYSSTFNGTNTDALRSYHPNSGVFSSYTTVSLERHGNIGYWYATHGTQPHTILKKSTTDLISHDFSNHQIKMSLTGEGEMIFLTSSGGVSSEASSIGDVWYFNMAYQNEIDFKLPNIPAEIIELYYPEGAIVYPFNSITLDKNIPEKPYDEFVQAIFNSEGYKEVTDYELIRKEIYLDANEGGRISQYKMNFLQDYSNFWPMQDRNVMKLLRQMNH